MENIEQDIIQTRRECATMLEKMIKGYLTAQQVIDRWPRDLNDNFLEEIYCDLYHYRDDEDIRRKDPKYAYWQNKEIDKKIKRLII